MNVNPYNTTDYKNISDWTLGENKPNTKPISKSHKPIKERQEKESLRNFFWLSVAKKIEFLDGYDILL